MKDKRTPRSLTQEELNLWRYITRHDTPMPDKAHLETAAHSFKQQAPTSSQQSAPTPTRMAVNLDNLRIGEGSVTSNSASVLLQRGDMSGIDKRTAERFRRGKMKVDATLDLHGHSQEQAHQKLVPFLRHSYDAHRRCLLVITGKGMRSEGKGVLQRMLPLWLNDAIIRPYILGFDYAPRDKGGEGAYLILLRRQRDI